MVVIAGFLTQSTSHEDQHVELNDKSCVFLSPYNWVVGNHVYYVSQCIWVFPGN